MEVVRHLQHFFDDLPVVVLNHRKFELGTDRAQDGGQIQKTGIDMFEGGPAGIDREQREQTPAARVQQGAGRVGEDELAEEAENALKGGRGMAKLWPKKGGGEMAK